MLNRSWDYLFVSVPAQDRTDFRFRAKMYSVGEIHIVSYSFTSSSVIISSPLFLISPWPCLCICFLASIYNYLLHWSSFNVQTKWTIKCINSHSSHFVSGHLQTQKDKTTLIYIAKIAIWNLQKYIFKQNFESRKCKVNTEHVSHSHPVTWSQYKCGLIPERRAHTSTCLAFIQVAT